MYVVLDILCLDSQWIEFQCKFVDLGDLFCCFVIEYVFMVEVKGLKLVFVLISVMVESDLIFLWWIVQNLVLNVIKYIDRGGVLVGVCKCGGWVWLEIMDIGIGIVVVDCFCIFDEFQCIGCEGGVLGMGLGFFIVCCVCVKLGYFIVMDSELGCGMVFCVSLFLIGVYVEIGCIVLLQVGLLLCGWVVLVVENDIVMCCVYQLILCDWLGMVVCVIVGIFEVLVQMGDDFFDVVIVDYNLDNGDIGFEVICVLCKVVGEVVFVIIVLVWCDLEISCVSLELGVLVLEKLLCFEDLQVMLYYILV